MVRPIESLVPYARNARTHSDAQVAQIAASIVEFGFTSPVLIDDEGGIVAGHGRVLAARQLGRTSVPCIVLDGLTKTQRRAYVLADNKLALNAGWDDALLSIEFAELKAQGFDLSLTGFDDVALSGLDDLPTPPVAVDIDPNLSFHVIVTVPTEQLQVSLCTELEARGLVVKLSMS